MVRRYPARKHPGCRRAHSPEFREQRANPPHREWKSGVELFSSSLDLLHPSAQSKTQAGDDGGVQHRFGQAGPQLEAVLWMKELTLDVDRCRRHVEIVKRGA